MLGIMINQEPSHDTANYRVKSPLSVNYQNLRLRNLVRYVKRTLSRFSCRCA